MNRDRNALNLLIQSLKGGEKRYFSKYSASFSISEDPPLYYELYLLLEKGESELQKKFSGTTKQSLTTTRKRLYSNILRSLRQFHQDSSSNQKLQGYLSDVENLYNLGLAPQALIPLGKAFGIVYRFEKFGFQLQVLDWEKRLNIVLATPTRSMDVIRTEEETVLRQLSQIKVLETIYGRIMSFKKQYGFIKGDTPELVMNETVASAEMPVLDSCISKKAVYYHNFIYAIYHWMTFEHEKSYEFSQKLLFDDNSSILPHDYLNGILQHITSSVCLARFKDALFGISFARTYIEKFRLDQSALYSTLVFAYHATYRLIVHMYMGNRGQLIETISYVSNGLEQFSSSIQSDMKQIILGNLLVAHMAVHDYTKADEVWNTLFNKGAKQVRKDVYADLFLFRLFMLLHEKRYELLPTASLSASRFYEKSENYSDIEYPITQLLQKERNYEGHELSNTIQSIKAILEAFISKVSKLQFQEHYTRYVLWCDAISEDRPFYEVAERWYNTFESR